MALVPFDSWIGQGLLTLGTMIIYILSTTDPVFEALQPLIYIFFVIPLFVCGLIMHFSSLDAQASRYSGVGCLIAANSALFFLLVAGGQLTWSAYCLGTVVPAYVGMVGGAIMGGGRRPGPREERKDGEEREDGEEKKDGEESKGSASGEGAEKQT